MVNFLMLTHYGAIICGLVLGLILPMRSKVFMTPVYILGGIGALVGFYVFSIAWGEPANGFDHGWDVLFFMYGIVLLLPMLIVPPLLLCAGWMTGHILRSASGYGAHD